MIEELLKEKEIDEREVIEIVISANTTMTHLLLGEDARSLGKFSYKTDYLDAQEMAAKEIGLELSNAKIYAIAHVSAFIGSDITSGVISSDLISRKGNVLFIDIGTNGYILASGCQIPIGTPLENLQAFILAARKYGK